jgi:hypothetical protein
LLCLLFLVHLRPRWLLCSLLLPSPWLPIESNRGRKRLIEESCCMISSHPDWLLLNHIGLLLFRVHLRPSWLCNRIRSRSKRLIVELTPPNLRSHLVLKHIIASACTYAEAVLLTHQSYRQQRRRRRQKGMCFGSNFTTNTSLKLICVPFFWAIYQIYQILLSVISHDPRWFILPLSLLQHHSGFTWACCHSPRPSEVGKVLSEKDKVRRFFQFTCEKI